MFFPRVLFFFITMTLYYYTKDNEEENWRKESLMKAEKLLSNSYCNKRCILNALMYAEAENFILRCFNEYRNLSKRETKTFIRDKLRNCINLRTPKHKNYKYNWTIGVIPNHVSFIFISNLTLVY